MSSSASAVNNDALAAADLRGRTPADALATLMAAGIVGADGQLAPQYRAAADELAAERRSPMSPEGQGVGPYAGILVDDGEFEGRYNFRTEAELAAFAAGVEAAGDLDKSSSSCFLTRADLESGLWEAGSAEDRLMRQYLPPAAPETQAGGEPEPGAEGP